MTRPVPEAVPPSRKKQLIAGGVTLVTLAIVLGRIPPQLADYDEAWAAVQNMPATWLLALVVAAVVNIIVYVCRTRRPCRA